MAISRTQKKQLDSQAIALLKAESARVKNPGGVYSYLPKHTKQSKTPEPSSVSSKSSTAKGDSESILGYDIALIGKDLKMTLFVSLLLVAILLGLAWYLPFGVLSA